MTYRVHIGLGGLVLGGNEPAQTRGLEGGAQVVDALDDSLLVVVVPQVRRGGDEGTKIGLNGHATTRGGATAEVQRDGHRG